MDIILNETEIKIIRLLEKHPNLSSDEIQKKLKLDFSERHSAIRNLVQIGALSSDMKHEKLGQGDMLIRVYRINAPLAIEIPRP